jgi:deoxycytidine triphosphate deaminase
VTRAWSFLRRLGGLEAEPTPVPHLHRPPDVTLKSVSREIVRRDAGETTIEYAFVTLHVGEVVWRSSGRDAKREVLGIGDETEIGPGEAVSIMTDERVTLPPSVSGTIFPKGRIAAIGLVCPATTIDPRFDQHLHVNVINVGSARVRLPRGLGIAKMELTRLPVAVERPYAASEDPKTHYPRDDYVFAGAPLVKDSFRLEHQEERLTSLEQASQRGAVRQRRILAVLLLCIVMQAITLLHHPLMTWIRSLSEAQSRSLLVSIVGGLVLTGALAALRRAYRQRRSLGEWLVMLLPQPMRVKEKPVQMGTDADS